MTKRGRLPLVTLGFGGLCFCTTMTKHEIESCMYEGGFSAKRFQYSMDMTVYEAKTANVVATKTFEGDPPECLDSIKTRNGRSTYGDFDGLSPMASTWKPWLTDVVVAK